MLYDMANTKKALEEYTRAGSWLYAIPKLKDCEIQKNYDSKGWDFLCNKNEM